MRDHVRAMLDPELLLAVNRVVTKHGQDCLLVGAAAFELSSIRIQRFTMDVDFAVTSNCLKQLREFEEDLDKDGFRKKSPPCSYLYKGKQKVDIIPFGGIAQDGVVVLPEMDRPLTVLGFAEALKAAVAVRLECGLSLKVATPPAIFVLKTFAAYDRLRTDDLSDIRAILLYYQENPDLDLYYAENQERVHEFEKIGAWLLGREVGMLLEPNTYERFVAVWEEMLSEGSRYDHVFPRDVHFDPDERERRLDDLVNGIQTVLEGVVAARRGPLGDLDRG